MSCKGIFSSSSDSAAAVTAYLHDDGTTIVLFSPPQVNGVGVTLNLHYTPAEARALAEMLTAAADAADKVSRCDKKCGPGCGTVIGRQKTPMYCSEACLDAGRPLHPTEVR